MYQPYTCPQSDSLGIMALGPPLGVVVYIWPLVGLGQPFFWGEGDAIAGVVAP